MRVMEARIFASIPFAQIVAKHFSTFQFKHKINSLCIELRSYVVFDKIYKVLLARVA